LRILAFIPARYHSSRLPGKPLLKIGDKPMIQWTWEACHKHPLIDQTIVLTEDKRVFDVVIGFGGQVELTSPKAKNGTERIASIIHKYQGDILLNIQGDEPGISQNKLTKLISLIKNKDVQIATLGCKIIRSQILFDNNKVKIVKDKSNKAMYFSRQPIPANRDLSHEEWVENGPYYLHVGLYAFKWRTFLEIIKLTTSRLEELEKLEQLRWLENGFPIHIGLLQGSELNGIDTEEDIIQARKIFTKFYGK
jgi:3-deoxy-manno-octulosonate cytidylyltransferase (CMP-KDO synthetase)